MDKNSIIGFVLIALIMMGFFGYQSHQFKKQKAIQDQLDSIAAVEQFRADSVRAAYLLEHPEDTVYAETAVAALDAPVYADSLLNSAASSEEAFYTLANDKLEIRFSTRGAQPASVRVKDYRNYDSTDLYLYHEGKASLGFVVFAPTEVDTRKFNFSVVSEESDSSTLVMRLPFSGGGYIEQRYVLGEDSYDLHEEFSLVGMKGLIPRNVNSLDVDYEVTMPRMEKGYQNETRYSRLDFYYPGDKKPEYVGNNGRSGKKRADSSISWFAFQQQFFSVIMTAPNNFSSGEFSVDFFKEEDESHDLMACKALMRADFEPGQDKISLPFDFYMGPNHFQTLKAYDQKYEKIIPLGGWLVGWFTRFVIIPIFNWLHKFISNFGLIILLMTLIIKIVVFPFAFKSYSSSAKMQALKPWMDKINEKYPKQEDAMEKQKATMELYRKAGVSPMGGCLPTLLQFPILWAMFRFFPASIELRQQSFLWAEDLSAYDSILDFGFRIPLLGDHISLFALLMAVSMFFYSKIVSGNQMSGNDPNAKMMRIMTIWMMPIMMFFICNNLSSGLSYYYLLSNLITMGETTVIKKWFVKPEEIAAKIKESEGKPAPKSKWQQRLEEAQKMQRQMAAEQSKKNRRR
ncbi:MAG: membrane protein insertase YidC [Bacteroidales bacterium]|nr:membrane protein insertase YidC [Bacteroidales bacterium]